MAADELRLANMAAPSLAVLMEHCAGRGFSAAALKLQHRKWCIHNGVETIAEPPHPATQPAPGTRSVAPTFNGRDLETRCDESGISAETLSIATQVFAEDISLPASPPGSDLAGWTDLGRR